MNADSNKAASQSGQRKETQMTEATDEQQYVIRDDVPIPPDIAQDEHLVYETKLAQIEEDVKNGNSVMASPREILTWFGAKRRGVNVTAKIRKRMEEHGLKTFPDFEYEYIDGEVRFKPTDWKPVLITNQRLEVNSGVTEKDIADETSPQPLNEGLGITDPTYRLGKLPAANKKPLTVKPSDSIAKAVTLMMEHDYSQLAVVTTPSSVEGLFTWESLATRLHFGHTPKSVGECMARPHVISSELSIFDAVVEITRHDVALVRAPNKMITGIVTTFDLSQQFRQLGEPFLLLGEIENQIRRLLDGCFTLQELKGGRDDTDSEREINGLSDLTFGEYLRLIENQQNWTKLEIPLDRPEFVKKLDEVRVIRNSVMHFDPDGIDGSDLDALRKFALFLQRIADVKHSENVA
ncbi:CBS domain-containing protein [Rosistilla oblonga]|uniref:CBS domain-containing protein n=1 Tax=Rosistilla oblonga TaxID=2527990 RepID=UPI003A987555